MTVWVRCGAGDGGGVDTGRGPSTRRMCRGSSLTGHRCDHACRRAWRIATVPTREETGRPTTVRVGSYSDTRRRGRGLEVLNEQGRHLFGRSAASRVAERGLSPPAGGGRTSGIPAGDRHEAGVGSNTPDEAAG